MGSLTYLLSLCKVLGDVVEGTGPCIFSTIVPFGVHDFCVIDSKANTALSSSP